MVLAIAAVLGGFFLTRTPESTGESTEPDTFEPSDLGPETSDPSDLRGPETLRPTGGATSSTPIRTGQGQREQLGPNITMAEAGGDFQILAVDPRTKRPVEGMNVFLLDRSQGLLTEWQNRQADPRSLRQLMVESGRMAVTDADGIAYFQRILNGAVLAEGQGYRGTVDWIGPVESPLRIDLMPQTELEVYVVNDEDEAVPNVPVWIGPTEGSRWLGMIKRATGQDGLAKFDRVSAFANRAAKENPLGAFPGFPHWPRVSVPIEPSYLPNEPIDLPMPAFAPLTVKVIDATGAPIQTNLSIELAVAAVGEESTYYSILRSRTAMGEATFPFVGVGCPLRVRLSGIPELNNQLFEISGPPQAGQPAEVTLRWTQKRVIFVGQAVTSGSGAVAGRSLRATWSDGKDRRSLPVRTDEQGRFRIVMDGPEPKSLSLTFPEGREGPPLEANPTYSLNPNGGEHNLGTVYFDGLPLFLEGRVIDRNGVPVSGAHVRIENHNERRDGGGKGGSKDGDKQASKAGGGDPDSVNRDGGRPTGKEAGIPNRSTFEDGRRLESGWQAISGLTAMTDAQGTFRLYGRGYGRPLRAVASRRGFQPSYVMDVQPGGIPVTITLDGSLHEVNAREEATKAEQEEDGE